MKAEDVKRRLGRVRLKQLDNVAHYVQKIIRRWYTTDELFNKWEWLTGTDYDRLRDDEKEIFRKDAEELIRIIEADSD